MKRTILLITSLLVVGLVEGQATAAAPKPAKSAAASREKAKAETKEAARAIQDYAYAQRVEFVADMKKELVAIEKEMDKLSAKVDKSSGAAKTDAKAKLDLVRAKWAQAKKQLDRAESATESTWEDVKGSFKGAYDDLKDSFDSTRQWLSDKIAP